ncbi:CLUMA_CG014112, isoform A [Clunio marinus]|uniref:Cytochrome b-c1 complex subunit 9 n=1 Tax=Clunio marinus TaxID=568069 RepID=A0A1J1IKU8_9DIPT|nr:CLUMA_CG014112, isoform A [Clunio marinus]
MLKLHREEANNLNKLEAPPENFSTAMRALYNLVFKRTSTYAVGIMASVFFFERAFDVGAESLFEYANKGKLWKDIKDKYEQE